MYYRCCNRTAILTYQINYVHSITIMSTEGNTQVCMSTQNRTQTYKSTHSSECKPANKINEHNAARTRKLARADTFTMMTVANLNEYIT